MHFRMSRLGLCLACAVGLAGCSSESAPESAPTVSAPAFDPMANTPFMIGGLNSPRMIEGKDAAIAEDAEVIGVEMAGGARAYVLADMAVLSNHIINDVVDGAPLSVTYCDATETIRVFTKKDSNASIDLSVAGRRDGKMLVRLDDGMYLQDASDIPLDEVKFVRTDWKTWYASHPETLLFIGFGPGPQGMPPGMAPGMAPPGMGPKIAPPGMAPVSAGVGS